MPTGEIKFVELFWEVEASMLEVDMVICIACKGKHSEDSSPDGGG